MINSLLKQSGATALIFDMDGTLVDNMGLHRLAWLEWAAREDLHLSDAELLSQTHGTVWEIAARLFPDDSIEVQHQRAARKEEIYRQIAASHLQLLPGLREFLEVAKSRCIPLALATAGDWNNIRFTLEKCDLNAIFDAVIGADDVQYGKPHPEVFLKAAHKLGMEPSKCLVFEDSPEGVEATRRAQMSCIVVNAMKARELYQDAGHILGFVRDYTEVSL